MDKEKSAKLESLLSDEEFMITLLSKNNKEDVKELFLAEGLEVSDRDIEILGNILIRLLSKGEELSDRDLALIAGGVKKAEGTEENLLSSSIFTGINIEAIRSRKNTFTLGGWVKRL